MPNVLLRILSYLFFMFLTSKTTSFKNAKKEHCLKY